MTDKVEAPEGLLLFDTPNRPLPVLQRSRGKSEVFNTRSRGMSEVVGIGSTSPFASTNNNIRSRGMSEVVGVAKSRLLDIEEMPTKRQQSNLARQYALTVMAKHIFEQAIKQKLIVQIDENNLQGVAFRSTKGEYAFYPKDHNKMQQWVRCLGIFNVGAAMTITTTVTKGIIDMIPEDVFEIAINHSCHMQVISKISDLVNARKAQGAAFILQERCVIVWSDEPEDLLQDAQVTHELLTRFLWNIAGATFCQEQEIEPPTPCLFPHLDVNPFDSITPPASTLYDAESSTSPSPFFQTVELPKMTSKRRFSVFDGKGQLMVVAKDEKAEKIDMEAEAIDGEYEERITVPLSAFTHGCAFALALVISILQLRQAFIWSLLDGDWSRMALIVVCPFFFFLVMFFCDSIFTVLCMLFGPIRQYSQNSRYYSGNKPKPLRNNGGPLPHITIQMPVYKEDFEFVLKPSFESIKKSIRTYELQGGSASMIISEDGMVLLDEVEKQKRLDYYEENNMTWIARPKHGKDGFVREGRFKKASNLNFTYDVLLKTESLLKERKKAQSSVGDVIHKTLYSQCLEEVLADIHPDACGSGIDFFGEYILMIDSDTRLPADCFLDAATEMTRSKDVGILQHCSGVMLVSTSFFEKCIAFFTRIVNFSISYAIANGDMAPFMGHNAYLRWSAMKEIAKTEILPNGKTQLKIWSEEHVSEDFVMALDMIERGYIIRWATYSNGEYLEGVSLSCDDELNRWQKYAWGVSEMLFRPIKQWHKGPFTPLITRFLLGNAPIHYKWSSMSYCFSYYAISLSFPLTIMLVLLQGWLGRQVIAPFTTSFQVLIVCLVVFSLAGSTSLCIARFRAGDGNFFASLKEYATFIPFLMVFFSGLSYHVATALISHLLAINMTWGATLKDIEMSNFFSEAPLILKRHYKLFFLSSIIITGLILLSTNTLPVEWRIHGITVLVPAFYIYGMHILFPIALNPNMVRFSF